MASYFDEHDCAELGPGQEPDHWLHLARLLLDSGLAVDLDMEFARLFGADDGQMPPTSQRFMDDLPILPLDQLTGQDRCAICLAPVDDGVKTVTRLPCRHSFHKECILPWIKRVSSCPLCKHELPTDDERYEEFKRQRKRKQERDAALQDLHDSMFG